MHLRLALLLLLFLPAAPVAAGVSEEQAARLGADLTPLGAERAGNAAGTIPAWTGGITDPPPGWSPGAWHADPYADDELLFTISAANAEQYADQLSEGQLALLRAYPDSWHMNVRPARRSASYPDFVYEAAKANASGAVLVTEGKGGVDGSRVTSPFPIPASGVEVMWNHNLRWRGIRVDRSLGSAAVTRRGNYSVVVTAQQIGIPYGSPSETAFRRAHPNVMLALKSTTVAPSLRSGDGTLIIEPINQSKSPRKTWIYNRALRKVLRLAHFAYDFPAPDSESLRTVDELDLYNGPPDRFEWTLHGKKELYVPYNAYALHGDAAPVRNVIGVGHVKPELPRYELHRVWVVEGRLREGEQHIYSRRVFYVDEDSWQVAVSESWDAKGRLWRVAENHAVNYYEVPVHWDTLQVYHDLQERRYYVFGLDPGLQPPRFREGGDPREFNPNALLYFVR